MNHTALETFIAVATERSFSRAADTLGVTQPVVSRRVQQLESDLGVLLIDRSNRVVTLTAAGTALLESGQRLLESASQLRESVKHAAEGGSGTLRIGFVGSAGFRILPELIRAYRTLYPDVHLELHEMTTAEQVDALLRKQIDAGLARPPVRHDGIGSRTIWRETFVAVLPDTHELADQVTVNVAQLCSEPFILFPRRLGPGYYDRILEICDRAGFTPHIGQEAVQMPTIVGFVGAGLGVALVPETVADFRLRGVVYRPIDISSPESEMALLWNEDIRSPVLDHFMHVAGAFEHVAEQG